MREDMKILIAENFTALLEKEDIDKITVKQLIEECHISRQTFYYHFRDIMDVLEWTFRRAATEAAEQSLESENHLDALRIFTSFVVENKKQAGPAGEFEKLDPDRGHSCGISRNVSGQNSPQANFRISRSATMIWR